MVRRDPESTRRELVDAAYEQMYANGFRATGLDQILAGTQVTKGALYHHFGNKNELGYAVLEEVIRPMMLDRWLSVLRDTDDPATALRELMYRAFEEHGDHLFNHGCPLNNLTQEMSEVDEGFRTRIEAILKEWTEGVAEALQRGIDAGNVRADVDPVGTAAFLIAGWEGMAGMAKGTRDVALIMRVAKAMEGYLATLKPVAVGAEV